MAVQSSSNRVTRLLGIDTDPVNQGWLCDKGRFAFDAVNSEDRLTEPLVRKVFAAAAQGAAAASGYLLAPKKPHFPAKAKHVVFLFMNGAPSQVDTFDPKPALTQLQRHALQGQARRSAPTAGRSAS